MPNLSILFLYLSQTVQNFDRLGDKLRFLFLPSLISLTCLKATSNFASIFLFFSLSQTLTFFFSLRLLLQSFLSSFLLSLFLSLFLPCPISNLIFQSLHFLTVIAFLELACSMRLEIFFLLFFVPGGGINFQT